MRRIPSLAGAIALLTASHAGAVTLQTDDVLVDEFGSGAIQQFRGGTLVDTITSPTTTSWAGVVVTPAGHIATVHRTPTTGLSRFTPAGGVIAEPALSGVSVPTDLGVLSDGTFAVVDINADAVDLFSPSGASLGTLSSAKTTGPVALAVAADDTVWVVSRTSMHADHFARDGTHLGGFALGFDPGEIIVDSADGTLWIAEIVTGIIAHRDVSGADLGTIATGITASEGFPFEGLAIDGIGDLLVIDRSGSQVLAFQRDGSPDGSFPLPSANAPFRMTVVPEPAPAVRALAAIATSLWLRRRR
jgi:DNA-binding beta-propeller fold protein YncE